MTIRYAPVLICAALAACGDPAAPTPNPVATDAASAAVEDDRPVGARRTAFLLDEVDARDLIEALGAQWRNPVIDNVSPDSHSGGNARSMTFRGRSAEINTLADGKVWNLKVRSGWGDQCGRAAELAPHIAAIYAKLQPGKTLGAADLASLVRGLDEPAAREVVVDGVKLITVGTCIRTLDIRTSAEAAQS